MNTTSRLYLFIVMAVPAGIFAAYTSNSMTETNSNNQQQMNNPYSQKDQNQSYSSNVLGDNSWDTGSSRMNRSAEGTLNNRSIPNQNREGKTVNRSWESTSSRMNRQAADQAASTPSNQIWLLEGQNPNPNQGRINPQR